MDSQDFPENTKLRVILICISDVSKMVKPVLNRIKVISAGSNPHGAEPELYGTVEI